MKKRWAFAALLAVTLVGSMACRLWQRQAAWEEGGLLAPGHPSTYLLVALTALAAVGFLLLGRFAAQGRVFESYLDAFALPHKSLLVLYVLAGALMVAGGVVGLLDWSRGLEPPISQNAMSVAMLFGGVGTAMVGWVNAQREEAAGRFAWPLLLPAYAGCVWLIATYQARATEPAVMGYLFAFLGGLCAVVFCAVCAGFSFEKPMPVFTLWLGGVGLAALGAALVDAMEAGDTIQSLTTLGYMLYLTAQTKCLLTRADAPAALERWTPPETEDAENEVTDHE